MPNPSEDPQMGQYEELLDDADLKQAVLNWAPAWKEKRALNTRIRELGVDEKRDKVAELMPPAGDEKVEYRIVGTQYLVTSTPPGEPKPVAFDTNPSRRLTLGEAEPEGVQGELGNGDSEPSDG